MGNATGEPSSTAIQDADASLGARFLILWIIPVAVAAVVSFVPPILNDGDTFWHVATGGWILDHGQVPHADPFSFTFAGKPWVAHEWLSEVVMAAAFRLAGWSGVMLLTGLCAGAVAAIMARWLVRWTPPLVAVTALAVGLACVAPSLLARPHIVSLPLLALWTVALLDARSRGRSPSLWLIPLMTLWANLHSSFIVGIGLAAAVGLEASLARDSKGWRTPVAWSGFALAALAAALVTPQGLEGLAFPLRVLGMRTLPSITEWRGPDFMRLEPMEPALAVGLLAVFWKGARLGFVRAVIVLGLVHMAFQHTRQEVLLGVIAPLVIIEPLGRALGAQPARETWTPFSRELWPRTALAVALLVGAAAIRLALPLLRQDGPTAPISALAHAPAELRHAPVLNDYDFGGYLIFASVRPYIDGRADMYGDAFIADDDALQRGDAAALARAVGRWRIRWAILAPSRPLVGVLDADPAWRRLYADRYAVLFVRNPPP